MPTTLAPVAPGPQPRTRWTVTQFNRMGDMGWFEGRRAFLLDGVILENGPMNAPHATALLLVHSALLPIFGAGWCVRGQSPLNIDEFNNPLPDFAVVRGDPDAYFDIASALMGAGRTEEAVSPLWQTLLLQKDREDVWTALAGASKVMR